MMKNWLHESLQSIRFFLRDVTHILYKSIFERCEFYETLSALLDNKMSVSRALSHMLDVASDDGKKRIKNTLMYVLMDCIEEINNGSTLGDALFSWIPTQESTLIKTGEEKGNLSEALRRACIVARGKSSIKKSIIGAMVYPFALFSMCFLIMNIVYEKIIPKLVRLVPRDQWGGALKVVADVSEFFIEKGLFLLFLCVIVFMVIGWSIPNYNGVARKFLDFLPPWSVYRIFEGVLFLFNISALMQINIDISKALKLINENTSPWLNQRLKETEYFTRSGKNLGVALRKTGLNFPSKKCVNHMILLTEGDNASKAMISYADRWLEESIKSIKKISGGLTMVCMLLVFSYTSCLVLAITELQSILQK